jgi:hypothetical protein
MSEDEFLDHKSFACLFGFIDRAHATLPQQADDPVFADPGRDRWAAIGRRTDSRLLLAEG